MKKGQKHTEEARRKISLAGIGRPSPNKGKKMSGEARKKMSLAKQGNIPWNKGTKGLMKAPVNGFKKGCTHLVGTHHSQETIEKQRKPRPNKRGENAYNWKGGLSKSYKHQTTRFEYRKWRRDLFERDNYTCQNCGKYGGYLTAHHIKSWTYFPDLRYDLSNGLTLCENCHSKTDNYKGRREKKSNHS